MPALGADFRGLGPNSKLLQPNREPSVDSEAIAVRLLAMLRAHARKLKQSLTQEYARRLNFRYLSLTRISTSTLSWTVPLGSFGRFAMDT